MPIHEIHLIPALSDNYIAALVTPGGEVAIVDPGEAAPVIAKLAQHDWRLRWILLTHHHPDHTGGTEALRQATGARVAGVAGDRHRLPVLDYPLHDHEQFDVFGEGVHVMHVPGHTLGHVAYHFFRIKAVFTGDTLFSLGCGRLFEGTPEQMFKSLARLAALPEDTQVFCGHEYTQANTRFALHMEPDNRDIRAVMAVIDDLRAGGMPTLPSTIGREKRVNPFLRAESVEAFAALRRRKDQF